MKSEDLKKIKEEYIKLKAKRDEVLDIKKEISKLEEMDIIKRYFELQELLEEKTSGPNTRIDNLKDEDLILIALGSSNITPDEEIYVYLGTFKYNSCEMDIEHGSSDIEVKRTCSDADYVRYQNIESKYNGIVEIPYKKADYFEETHKVIIPKNVASKESYFYDLQEEYFITAVLESKEKAISKINKLIK